MHISLLLLIVLASASVNGSKVYSLVNGEIGDQLFQIFNAFAYCFRHQKSLVLLDANKSPPHGTHYWENLLSDVKYYVVHDMGGPDMFRLIPERDLHHDDFNYYFLPKKSYLPHQILVRLDAPMPIPNYDIDILFNGSFQSPKYFEDMYEEILIYLKFPPKILRVYQEYESLIDFSNSVSLHFRLENINPNKYSYQELNLEYYVEALTRLLEKSKRSNWTILCFYEETDSHLVVHSLKKLQKLFSTLRFETIHSKIPDWKQMILMSLCAHSIIANNAFSWWGAYLRKEQFGLVFAPNIWPGIAADEEFIPIDWIVISVNSYRYLIYEKSFHTNEGINVLFQLYENDNLLLVASEFCERNSILRSSCFEMIKYVENKVMPSQVPSSSFGLLPATVTIPRSAWVTVANTELRVQYALVLFQSLRNVETVGSFVLLLFGSARYDLFKRYLGVFKKLNIYVHLFDMPMQLQHVKNYLNRKLLDEKGLWWEFSKLEAFKLTMYNKVVLVDNDFFFIKNADELLFRPDGSATDGLFSPLDSGLIVIQPSEQAYDTLSNVIKSGHFSRERDWSSSLDQRFDDHEAIAAVLHYYYKYVRKTFHLLNRQVYRYHDVEPFPSDVKIVEFKGCGKPDKQVSVEQICPTAGKQWTAIYGELYALQKATVFSGEMESFLMPSQLLSTSGRSYSHSAMLEAYQSSIRLLLGEVEIHVQEERSCKNATFLGVNFESSPYDAFSMQALLYEVKPDLIIATGGGGGASVLYSSILMEHINPKCKIVLIDPGGMNTFLSIYPNATDLWNKRVTSVVGQFTDTEVVKFLKENFVEKSEAVMVLLGANPDHDVVASELQLYSNFVTIGSFIVLQNVDFEGVERARDQFLAETGHFEIDTTRKNAIYEGCTSCCYLRRIPQLSSEFEASSEVILLDVSPDVESRSPVGIPAFILASSNLSQSYRTTASAATEWGCDTYFVKSTTPDDFSSAEALIRDTFEQNLEGSLPDTTEAALANGHKRTLHQIAVWPALRNDDWALVIEEGVSLHPDFTVLTSDERKAMLYDSVELLSSYGQNGLLYLGACDPECARRGTESFLAFNCISHCSSAYAVTKRRARTLFDEAYSACENILGCGNTNFGFHEALERLGHRYKHHKTKSNSLLGYGLVSPGVDGSINRGIAYRTAPSDHSTVKECAKNNVNETAPNRIVIGVGPGYSGMRTIAHMLNAQSKSFVTFQAFDDCEQTPWLSDLNRSFVLLKSREFLLSLKRKAALNCDGSSYIKLLGDVASWHLPYVEGYLQDPDVLVFGIIGNRDDTVASFENSARHFHWNNDGEPRNVNSSSICYPMINFSEFKEMKKLSPADMFSVYYDDYIKRIQELAALYPSRVFVFDSHRLLNDVSVQAQLLDLIGSVSPPYKSYLDVEHMTSQDIERNLRYLRENPSRFGSIVRSQGSKRVKRQNMFLFEGDPKEVRYLQAKQLGMGKKHNLLAEFLVGNQFCELYSKQNVAKMMQNIRSSDVLQRNDTETVRVLCVIITYAKNHALAAAAALTWGKKCDGFLAFSNVEDLSVPTVALDANIGEESYSKLWYKKVAVYKEVLRKYFDPSMFDYIFFGDDDTYVVVPNLVEYLATDSEVRTLKGKGTYIGRRTRFNARDGYHDYFNAGGGGYVLDGASLKALVQVIEAGACRDKFNLTAFQADQNTANCLAAAGIFPIDSRDSMRAQRFHQRIEGGDAFDVLFSEGIDISVGSISFHKAQNAVWMYQLDLYLHHCNKQMKTVTIDSSGALDWFNKELTPKPSSWSSKSIHRLILLNAVFDELNAPKTVTVRYGDSLEQVQSELVRVLKLKTHYEVVSSLNVIVEKLLDTYGKKLSQPLSDAGLSVFWGDKDSVVTISLEDLLEWRYCMYFGLDRFACKALQYVILRKIWRVAISALVE